MPDTLSTSVTAERGKDEDSSAAGAGSFDAGQTAPTASEIAARLRTISERDPFGDCLCALDHEAILSAADLLLTIRQQALADAASLAKQYALASYEHTCFVEFNDLADAILTLSAKEG